MSAPRILLVIGGGIAAYKACELVRLIRRHGGEVTCVLTEGGAKFVTPLALAALSENPVYTTLWDLKNEVEMGHIQLSRSADLIVVCPATADLMAKMAAGIADDLATTLLLATDKPVMTFPAMNVRMWQHAATVRNVATLRAAGVAVIEPDEGAMACGEFGPGRLPEPPMVWDHIAAMLGIGGTAETALAIAPPPEPAIAEVVSEPEVVAEAEPLAEPEAAAEPEVLDAPEADVEPETEAEAAAESEPDAEPEPVVAAEAAIEPEPEALPEPEVPAEPEALAEPEVLAEPEALEPEPLPEPEPEPQTDTPIDAAGPETGESLAEIMDSGSDESDLSFAPPPYVPASADSLYEALEPEDEPEESETSMFGGLSASLISRSRGKKSALDLGAGDPAEFAPPGYSQPDFAGADAAGPDFAVGGYAGPEFGGPDFGGPDHGGAGYDGPQFGGPDFAGPDFADQGFGNAGFAGPDFSSPDFRPMSEDADAPPPVINLNSPLLSKKGKARGAPPTDPDAINHTVSRHGDAVTPQPFTIGLDAAPLPGAVDPLDGQPDFEKDPPHRPLAGKHVLVTAGPTYEAIDPVRYIANRSSGKQGYAIAAAAAAAGARVTLVSGPVMLPTPPGVDRIDIESAREMAEAVKRSLPADVGIMVAAVADWRTRDIAGEKIKKRGSAPPALLMVENPDILATLAGDPKRPKLLIGFAAETEKLLEHATEKRKRKGADWIIANDVSGDVMGGNANCVHIVTSKGVESLPEMPKDDVAFAIVERIADALAG